MRNCVYIAAVLLLLVVLPAQADIIINMPGAGTTATNVTVPTDKAAPNNVAKPQPYNVQRPLQQSVPQQNVIPNQPPNQPVRACTKMWCREGVTINLPIVNTPGQYRFVVTADGERYTCTGTLPLNRCGQASSSCDKPGILVGESGCALAPPMHNFNSLFLAKVPRVLEVDVTLPGRQPIRTAGQLQPQCFYPNGPQCDARPCCQAQINVGQ